MKRSPLASLLWLVMAAVAGCSDSDQIATTRKKITLEPTLKPPAEDPTKKMAQAVSFGNTGAPVELKYQFGSKPEIAATCALEIAVIPQAPMDSLEVTVSGMEGIELDGELSKTLSGVKQSEPYLQRFSLVPLRPGVFYITVNMKLVSETGTLERSFAIPFIAGDLAAVSAPKRGKSPKPDSLTQATAAERKK